MDVVLVTTTDRRGERHCPKEPLAELKLYWSDPPTPCLPSKDPTVLPKQPHHIVRQATVTHVLLVEKVRHRHAPDPSVQQRQSQA